MSSASQPSPPEAARRASPAITNPTVLRRLAGGLAAVAFLLGAGAESQAPVRVMTFNIRYATSADGEHAWPHRAAHVVATIRDHAPHVLGVQEALRVQLDLLAAELPRYLELGVGREDGRTAGEYAALLVDTARFTVLAHGTFWFSETPGTPGSVSWGNRITRIATWARLADRITGDTARVYNLHWDHESQPSRERSAALLLRRIAADGGAEDAIIVLGDFNADEANPAIASLLADASARLRNAYRVRHPADTAVGTFHGFRGEPRPGMIDQILIGPGWAVDAAGIDRRQFGSLWASDHFAVWGILRRE